ncbi:MAG: bifunctional nicotinamidase/pyrazinamidase [Balneolaceae bacterium]
MKTLLIVDLQNDFCPGGALQVPDGDKVVPVINRLIPHVDHVIQSQDWHPPDHLSFASSHPDKEPFQTVFMDYGEQVLWPDHCVQDSRGAEFHPDLNTTKTEVIIRKGFRKEIDSYSAFYENDQQTSTGLGGYLADRGLTDLYVCGLATDFCVKWSVLDGIKGKLNVRIIKDAVKGLDIESSVDKAWTQMREAGVRTLSSADLMNHGFSLKQ